VGRFFRRFASVDVGTAFPHEIEPFQKTVLVRYTDDNSLRIVFRVGWQVSNPMNYQQGTEASRYPAAVLRQAA
jgi:hypothetical protein